MHFRIKEVLNTIIFLYRFGSQCSLLQHHKAMVQIWFLLYNLEKSSSLLELSGSLELRKTGILLIIFHQSTK